jgi:hypothetical protein
LAIPAFAADTATTATTREERMRSAYEDFQSGKAPMTVPEKKTPTPSGASHRKTTKK